MTIISHNNRFVSAKREIMLVSALNVEHSSDQVMLDWMTDLMTSQSGVGAT